MKSFNTKQNSGSVLLATMIFVLAIAAYMIYYLQLVQNSNQSVARAQRWNAALPVAEAGIEEGMAILNSQGFALSSNTVKFSNLSHSLNGGTYYVSSMAAGVTNTITSTGMVTAPITGDKIYRAVRVTAQRQALFSKGIVAMTDINMNGNGVAVDSYNSLLGPYSSGSAGKNGDVAALNGIVNLKQHTIAGDLFLGPNAEFQKGTVTGTVYTDWNMQFPDATLPTVDANGNALPSIWPDAPYNPTNSTHTITNSGYYTIRDNENIIVNTGAVVTLDVKVYNYIPKGITIQGGTNNAGTVILYQESGSLTLSGNASGGAYNNPPAIPSSQPKNFAYFGLPGVNSITFSGNATFIGVIYAPQVNLKFNGGGSDNLDFQGSLIVNSVTMGGHFDFHYDTSLIGYYFGYYVVGSWQEL